MTLHRKVFMGYRLPYAATSRLHALLDLTPAIFGGGFFLLCLVVRSPKQERLSYVK